MWFIVTARPSIVSPKVQSGHWQIDEFVISFFFFGLSLLGSAGKAKEQLQGFYAASKQHSITDIDFDVARELSG